MQKQGKELSKLGNIIAGLMTSKKMDEAFKDHPLRGNYSRTRECHIEPDWLLIYRVIGDELHLLRTGSHSELFKK